MGTDVRRALAMLLAGLSMSALVVVASPARAADPAGSDYNCSYTVPKAGISSGTLKFSLPVRCDRMGGLFSVFYTKRQVIVDVMWDTGVLGMKQFVSWHGKALSTNATSVTFSKSGIWCNKNPRGSETIYLKARIEAYYTGPGGIGAPAQGWNKGKDVWGGSVLVNCT